jgi:hypothetical protein
VVKILQIYLPFSKETEQINAVAQLVEALRYEPEVGGSIPDVIAIFY